VVKTYPVYPGDRPAWKLYPVRKEWDVSASLAWTWYSEFCTKVWPSICVYCKRFEDKKRVLLFEIGVPSGIWIWALGDNNDVCLILNFSHSGCPSLWFYSIYLYIFFQDISLSQWLALTVPDLVKTHQGSSNEVVDRTKFRQVIVGSLDHISTHSFIHNLGFDTNLKQLHLLSTFSCDCVRSGVQFVTPHFN
jgi:hypothetical protein